VLNLFNRKNEVTSQSGGSASPSDEYSMGRQYYASARYEF
jgi:outer membrane receptor protein involved in Fe transport